MAVRIRVEWKDAEVRVPRKDRFGCRHAGVTMWIDVIKGSKAAKAIPICLSEAENCLLPSSPSIKFNAYNRFSRAI